MEQQKALTRLHDITREASLVASVISGLSWDQETYMPSGAIDWRAEQTSYLTGLLHEKVVNPDIAGLLAALGVSPENPLGDPSLPARERGYLRVVQRRYLRETKLPASLVTELAKVQSLGQAAWVEARTKNDFPAFMPFLERILELDREAAKCYGYSKSPYDALIEDYEVGATEAQIKEIFAPMEAGIVDLVGRIEAKGKRANPCEGKKWPAAQQEAFSRRVMVDMGYDLARGRLDITAHPFTTNLGSDDVRITTRYLEDNVLSALFSTVHEAGHALYEQGFDPEIRNDWLADGASMGVHESQSRFWENVVARSLPFWRRYYPELQGLFPSQLSGVGVEDFHRAANIVERSPIRVEADEVTYGLHIILRFKLESALLSGDLAVADLPAAWAAESQRLLGFKPKNDAQGCLQDVHWSMGLVGYFPSYALGNLYCAQFLNAMEKEIGSVETLVGKGEFGAILSWLRKNVHHFGKEKLPSEIVLQATGEPLSSHYFLGNLERKYTELYGL
jgi:carboxypeptidase Taq